MCTRPINVRQQDGTYIKVPCGRCFECRQAYQRQWQIRMEEQLKACKGKAVFFTLTYDDFSIPKNYLYNGEIYKSYTDYNYDNTAWFDETKARIDEIKHTKGYRKDEYLMYELKRLQASLRGKKRISRIPASQVLTDVGFDNPEIVEYNLIKDKNLQKEITDKYKYYYDSIWSSSTQSNSDNLFAMDFAECDRLFMADDTELQAEEAFAGTEVSGVPEGDSREIEPFDGEKVIAFNSVRMDDVKDWLNRSRTRFKRMYPDRNFTYFITAEYGPRTLRPHYHGILFGASPEETMFMKADWIAHFSNTARNGSRHEICDWKQVDVTKGGCSYVSKYCSKGFFENPLCARDFYYFHPEAMDSNEDLPVFTEYHSKHYERCMELFGIDKPIVDECHHLVSKGMGISYVNDANMEYFGITQYNELSRNTDTTEDLPSGKAVVARHEDVIKYDMETDKLSITTEYNPVYNKVHKVFTNERQIEEVMEGIYRKYHYTTKSGFALAMPNYYRAKMFDDNLRNAFAIYVQQRICQVYQEKLSALAAQNPSRSDTEICSLLEANEREAKKHKLIEKYNKSKKFYNKSKL